MMMNLAASLLIVSAAAAAPSEHHAVHPASAFRCDFDGEWDKNFDKWPDGWWRAAGPRFPHYVGIGLHPRSADQPDNKHLQVDLDGGEAVVESPAIQIDARLAYVFSCELSTVGLKHDRALVSITFYDAVGEQVATHKTAAAMGTTGWKTFRVGTIWPPSTARHAKIGLRVEAGDVEDLTGSVMLDDLQLLPLLGVSLSTGHRNNLFASPDEVQISCVVAGFEQEQQLIALELENALGEVLNRVELPVAKTSSTLHDPAVPDDEEPGESPSRDTAEPQPLRVATVRWRPPVDTGFFRVRAKLVGAENTDTDREITIAVLDEHVRLPASEFGWSLPDGDDPVGLEELPELLSQAGVGWVKFPLWLHDEDSGRLDALGTFADRLHGRQIRLIGVLADPPALVRDKIPHSGPLTAAHIFSADPQVWYPSLESNMTRLGMKIRWWQLGDDDDNSFVEYPELAPKFEEVQQQLLRAAPDAQLGFGWNWLDQPPTAPAAPWKFLFLSADPPLSARELIAHLDAIPLNNVKRWVQLRPLQSGTYNEESRAIDLIERMMAAKMHGASAVFVPEPFSPAHGLMREDGTPGPLLLPWRTAARALAGTKPAGTIQLPGSIQNDVFLRADEAVLVVRGDTPAREEVFLGHGARQVDIWGRSRPLDDGQGRQSIEVAQQPTFVIGASSALVLWRQSVDFQQARMPHVFGEPHPNALVVSNPFTVGVSGTARLVLPDGWTAEPEKIDVQLGPGEQTEAPLLIYLPLNADSGKQPVRVDFDLQVDQRYEFSVYRELEVGLGDVGINVVTRLNASGELEVEQHLVNNTGQPISFRCQLFAPRRLRQSKVVECPPQSQATETYVFPDGSELVGQSLWIRAEEISGSRVLNRRFNAER